MSNRGICKQRKSSSIFKRAFLSRVIIHSKEIPIYNNYFKCRLRSYIVLLLDSLYYIEYVRPNCSEYNILGLIIIHLKILFSIYIRLKIELKNIFKK